VPDDGCCRVGQVWIPALGFYTETEVEEASVKRGGWCLAVLLVVSSTALAQEVKEKKEPRSWFGAGLSYAALMFDDDVYQEIFDQDFFNAGTLTFSFYPVRNLALTLGTGGMYQTGMAVGETTGRESGEKLDFLIVPAWVEAGYRFDFVEDQVLVPSVRAGGDYWIFQEQNEFADDVEGGKAGWHVGAGLGFLLDRLDPDADFELMSEYGIENTFLELGASKTWMKSDGLDFSGWVFQAGFLFEF